MKLALKRTPASNATLLQRIFAALTRWRLVSQYSHGGIVVNGYLIHATTRHGLTIERFNPAHAGWDLFELGTDRDDEVELLFDALGAVKYDWLSLLAFVLPWRVSDRKRLYCFEWCALAMGLPVAGRITPELLLAAYAKHAATTTKGEHHD